MPAFVRKASLSERLQAALNPYDFLLWLSEEIDTYGYDQLEKEWAIPIAVGLNLLFLVVRSNVYSRSRDYDDVFGEGGGPGWVAGISWFLTHLMTLLCLLNTFYTFFRRRHYRLFENPIDEVPSTPSARRVRVDSFPVSSSPLRFLSSVLGTDSAASRAHPDPTKDIWEVSVWDPLPVSLRLFTYFSPAHVILYWIFLPTLASDPRPSTTLATTILLAVLLTVQLSCMHSMFSQQSKDQALISKEVLREYDIKYVKPITQPLYRDVATQFSEQASHSTQRDSRYNKVETYKPAIVINRGFRTNPNPNYTHLSDPDSAKPDDRTLGRPASTPDFKSPGPGRNDIFSPMRPPTALRQPTFRPSVGVGDGGSLGIYSHAASPLRKTPSTSFTPVKPSYLGDVSRARHASSPEKQIRQRKSVPTAGLVNTMDASRRWGHLQSDRSPRKSGHF